MLGLLLLYWIGKYFYNLADEHTKSKWGYAILGILVYYSGTFVFGILIAVLIDVISPGFIDTFNEMLFGILMIPFGLLCAYVLYTYLKNSWTKKALNIPTILETIEDEPQKLL